MAHMRIFVVSATQVENNKIKRMEAHIYRFSCNAKHKFSEIQKEFQSILVGAEEVENVISDENTFSASYNKGLLDLHIKQSSVSDYWVNN